jgi:hypothetical protein
VEKLGKMLAALVHVNSHKRVNVSQGGDRLELAGGGGGGEGDGILIERRQIFGIREIGAFFNKVK